MSETLKKIVIFVSISVVGIFCILFGVGLYLPKEHIVSVERTYAVTPKKLWKPLVDVRKFKEMNPSMKKLEILSKETTPDKLVWKEYYSDTNYFVFHITKIQPEKFLRVAIKDSSMPLGGYWDFVLEEVDAKHTKVTITETGTVDSVLFRVFYKFFIGYDFALNMTLDSLDRILLTP